MHLFHSFCRSQPPGFQVLKDLPDEHHQNLWGQEGYYHVFSLVNGGCAVEDDLFAGCGIPNP